MIQALDYLIIHSLYHPLAFLTVCIRFKTKLGFEFHLFDSFHVTFGRSNSPSSYDSAKRKLKEQGYILSPFDAMIEEPHSISVHDILDLVCVSIDVIQYPSKGHQLCRC